MKYIQDEHSKKSGCIFCEKLKDDNDKENLILYRAKQSIIIMNLYPYNNGHLMVVPNKHYSDIDDLDEKEGTEINFLLKKCTAAIKEKMQPHGFNIGINIGQVAGAGIADHIHWHVVPRWEADTNFMPVIVDVRVIPQALEETYDLLKEALDE